MYISTYNPEADTDILSHLRETADVSDHRSRSIRSGLFHTSASERTDGYSATEEHLVGTEALENTPSVSNVELDSQRL